MIKLLITDLLHDKISIAQALTRAKVIAYKIKDENFKNWINSELLGYTCETNTLPNYRIININITRYVDIKPGIVRPRGHFGHRDNLYLKIGLKRTITDIEELHDYHKTEIVELPDIFDEVKEIKYNFSTRFDEDTFYCSITKVIYGPDLKKIVDVVKQKLIDTLLDLNDNFPNLENDFQMTEEGLRRARNITRTIIYGNAMLATGDNTSIKNANMEEKNYQNYGQAGAMGDNASASNFNQNQVTSQLPATIDFNTLSKDLKALKDYLQSIKDENNENHLDAISSVIKAEKAANNKEGNKVIEFLKEAGKWALDAATKIGTNVAAEVIKKSIG